MEMNFSPFQYRQADGSSLSGDVISREKLFVPTRRYQEVVVEEPKGPPPPPTFSEAELTKAKEEAYRRGFNDGEKKGKAFADGEIAKIDQAILALVPHVAKQVKFLFGHYNGFVREHKQTLPQLALALAKKLCGDLPDETLLAQVSEQTIQCVEQMLGEPELHIYVHPRLSDALEQRLAKHFANSHEPGDVLIHADENAPLGDCRVEWRYGGMEYRRGALLTQIDELVQGLCQQAQQEIETTTIAPPQDAVLDNAVAQAIAHQLTAHEIPPIPEASNAEGTLAATPATGDAITPTHDTGDNHG